MARVVGVDPGTMSMDILGFDDETMEVFLDEAVPREEVTRDPSIVIRLVERHEPIDAVVAPSGYGIPLKRARDSTPDEICMATFTNRRDDETRLRIHGLRDLMHLFRRSKLPAWFTPGVIHLPTVPARRKLGKIDMGTADKVFTVAAALRDEVERYGAEPGKASFIVVEVGYAYTAAIAVAGGAIVDGVGGTSGPPGYLGLGAWDAELAYALSSVEPGFGKERLFQGGAAYLASRHPPDPASLAQAARAGEPGALEAVEALAEGVARAVASLLPSNPRPSRIYLSGRMTRTPYIGDRIREAVEELVNALGLDAAVTGVSRLGANTKEAATGAAVIASGLAGGRYAWVVESLRLHSSRGTIFDYILIPGVAGRLREEFSSCRARTPSL